MLVGTMTNKEVLEELSKDYDKFSGALLTDAKKKMLEEREKSRKGFSVHRYSFVSGRNTPWFVEIRYDKRTRKLSYVLPIAKMESGSKYLYVLKLDGMDGCRAIQVFPPHCISRIRERIDRDVSKLNDFELVDSLFMDNELGCLVFADKNDFFDAIDYGMEKDDALMISGVGYFIATTYGTANVFKTFLGKSLRKVEKYALYQYLENMWVEANSDTLMRYHKNESDWPYSYKKTYREDVALPKTVRTYVQLGPINKTILPTGRRLVINSKDHRNCLVRAAIYKAVEKGEDPIKATIRIRKLFHDELKKNKD